MIDVVWSPYASCRDLKPFEDQTLYSGYIVVGTFMWSYLPKRVLRQFEYVQRIPLDPPKRPIAYEKYCDTWAKWDQDVVAVAEAISYEAPWVCTLDYLPVLVLQEFTSIHASAIGRRITMQSYTYSTSALATAWWWSDVRLCNDVVYSFQVMQTIFSSIYFIF